MDMRSLLQTHKVFGPVALRPAPPENAGSVSLGDSALDAMTDFTQVRSQTVHASASIDLALNRMMLAGVRLLFAVGDDGALAGLITSYDIQGEKPTLYLQSQDCSLNSCSRRDIQVGHIMEPADDWRVLDYEDVRHARIAEIVLAFKVEGRRHLVVVERAAQGDVLMVRGLFSLTQLERQLGAQLDVHPQARSFAEIERMICRGGMD